jgi:hypothetical protein
MDKNDELNLTVESLIDLDEPEALLETLKRAAHRKKGKRWQALAAVLGEAESRLDLILNAKPAGPDWTQAVSPASPADAPGDAKAKEE